MKKSTLILLLGLLGCARIPDGLNAVENFEVQRYLGTWYEIARLDHSFERGLSKVSATYTLKDDGTLRIVNRGFDRKKGRWKEAIGKAHLAADDGRGRLKVSFFGPFYGDYNIIDLDRDDYSHALVCGNSRSTLWILAREPKLPEPVLATLVEKARSLGFDTGALIFVDHNGGGGRGPEASPASSGSPPSLPPAADRKVSTP